MNQKKYILNNSNNNNDDNMYNFKNRLNAPPPRQNCHQCHQCRHFLCCSSSVGTNRTSRCWSAPSMPSMPTGSSRSSHSMSPWSVHQNRHQIIPTNRARSRSSSWPHQPPAERKRTIKSMLSLSSSLKDGVCSWRTLLFSQCLTFRIWEMLLLHKSTNYSSSHKPSAEEIRLILCITHTWQ